MSPIPSFAEWELAACPSFRGDPLWTVRAFRLAMYAIACHGEDCTAHPRLAGAAVTDQLTRALGSIAANIAEGHSRSSLADRLRLLGYALGSAREASVWYETLRTDAGQLVTDRQNTLIQIRRLLLTTLRRARPAGTTDALRNRRE
jgi:four helix bundle protein